MRPGGLHSRPNPLRNISMVEVLGNEPMFSWVVVRQPEHSPNMT